MGRIEEINARLAEINTELDAEGITEARVAELDEESRALLEERKTIEERIKSKQQLRSRIAAGTEEVKPLESGKAKDKAEERAKKFASTGRMSIGAQQTRSTLISGGTIATPTGVSGINDSAKAKHSSIIDMVKVVDCSGMGANKVAYISADAAAAADQTEGSAATAKEATFGYVTITPTSIAVTAQISEQVKKQSPLIYEQKVREQAFVSLRKAVVAKIVAALKASTLVDTVDATVSSSTGVINASTLRTLVLNYGGDESVLGNGVLFLNKTDLLAFGDVRGTNEKKAVYEIIPDGDNPNTGVIKDGGLSVRYCITSGLTACAGTSQAATATKTMFYGNPLTLELDLFSDFEVRVSEDFAFTSLMDTIRGSVEAGCDLVVNNGFVALTIPKTT